jgi:uncharacterized transporter YbjL
MLISSFVGWVERINMLRKTSQFSGKAKPNTQHLNPSESFCWVSLGVLLGFLTSTQPTLVSLGLWLGFVPQPNLQFRRLGWANKYVKENLSILRKSETQHPTPKSVWIFLLGLLGCIVGFRASTQPTLEFRSFVGWVERINRLKKTSQFSGKAKPNTQHLNPSESFCWVYLGVLLGFVPQPNLL